MQPAADKNKLSGLFAKQPEVSGQFSSLFNDAFINRYINTGIRFDDKAHWFTDMDLFQTINMSDRCWLHQVIL